MSRMGQPCLLRGGRRSLTGCFVVQQVILNLLKDPSVLLGTSLPRPLGEGLGEGCKTKQDYSTFLFVQRTLQSFL
jgi:hypothetical protein